MEQKQILINLKNIKTIPEKKWIYNFVAYIIKNQHDYQKLQVRINSIHYQSQGYYKKWYQELSQRDKVKYNKQNAKRVRTDKKILDAMKKRRKIEITAGKLYMRGLLSEISTHKIDDKLNEVL